VNKQELVNEVAKKADLPKTKAQAAVEAIFDSIKLTLKKGGEVRLVGFGTFTVAKRAATTGRNPRTGEKINIPASKQPKFKAGKELKEAVNKK
jgi:DNA-binding protein HU-beta